MKKTLVTLVLTLSLFVCNGQKESQVKPILKNIISDLSNIRDFAASSSEDEAYITAQSQLGEVSVILKLKKKKGKWEDPAVASFSGEYKDLEPFISPDELTLFFVSDRPLDASSQTRKDYDIWYVERTNKNSPWSKPKNIGSPINTENNEFYPSLSKNKNMYFTSDSPESKGKDDIFFSQWDGTKYLPPISLSDSINTEGYEFNSYIAPDESYLIFSGYNRPDGLGSGDLYISFMGEDGNWSKAKNLGEQINSKQMDYCPFVNQTSGALYFTSKRSAVKPQNFESYKSLLKEINKYENGLSRVYKAFVKEIID